MKKIILLFAFVFYTSLCLPQKIDLKKGLLSLDGQPVAKLEGKATLLKGTDVTLKSMKEEPLLNINTKLVSFPGPFHEGVQYYTINFFPLNKVVHIIITSENNFTSEKKLSQYLFERIGKDFLNPEGLNASTVEQYALNNDETQKINDDTVSIFSLIRLTKAKLTEPLIPRDVNADLFLKSLRKETISTYDAESLETFDLYKGNTLVGRILKTFKGDASIPGASTFNSKEVKYVVQRKVKAFIHDGENQDLVNLSLVKLTEAFPPDIYVQCDGAWANDLKVSDIYSAEAQIALWLMSKGCL